METRNTRTGKEGKIIGIFFCNCRRSKEFKQQEMGIKQQEMEIIDDE